MDTPNTPATAPAPERRRARGLGLAWALAVTLVTALALGLWRWGASEGSLAASLRLLAALLPGELSLHSSGVQGSLRHGGHIARLDWRQAGWSLQLTDLRLELDARRLLDGTLPLQRLRLGELRGERLASAPTAPLQQLLWPLRVDLDWQIDRLQWQAATPIEAHGLRGHYRFDGAQHQLALDQLQWAQGRYQGQLQWQGRSPMALQAQLHGELPAATRPAARQALALALQAQAELRGTLAGPEAALELEALVHAQGSPAPLQDTAPRLQLQARLRPQDATPLAGLQAQLRAIDLAALWPGAPQTRLDGHIDARPRTDPQDPDTDWQAEADLRNGLTGPWDQGRVPLQALQARAAHGRQGWALPSLQAHWPGGQLQGELRPVSGPQAPAWQGQWRIHRLQPGQWLSAGAGPALSGTLRSQQGPDGALTLQAQLVPDEAGRGPPGEAPGLELQARREGALWTLARLSLRWAEARVQAQGRWHADTPAFEGQAEAQLPGLRAQLGGQLSPQDGQGQWQIDAQDSQRLGAWLQRWPALRSRLQGWQAQGRWQAAGQWRGGWAAPRFQLQASAQSERLLLQGPAHRSQLEGLRLQVRGPWPALQAEWRAGWLGPQGRAELQGQAQFGRSGPRGSDWQGQLTELQLDWRARGQNASLQLVASRPLAWRWRASARQLQWQAQAWRLQGPDGQAALELQAGEWQAAQRAGAWPQVRLQATLRELPLRWAGLLGLPEVQGDVLLHGGLQLQPGPEPALQAWLERSRGDLLMRADSPTAPPRQAGLRAASARLAVQGTRGTLDLQWDSAQAGQLQAQLSSRLDPAGTLGALWPAEAPLGGRVQARLPRVDAWSWLAPPGWRMQGSLDARFELAGTRSQPRWQGTLQADDLALRSAVEGVAFGQGRLRARLQEQALLLDEFRLQDSSAQGGEVSARGVVRWLGAQGPAWQSVQMDLQVQARTLRVSQRADRRLTVSGQTRAQWLDGRMLVTGELLADSALFVLPDESTPRLGSDVVIVRPAPRAPEAEVGTSASAGRTAGGSLMGTPEVQVQLRLGPDFQLRGLGITTRLAGELQLVSGAATHGEPRLYGQVRTEGGRYRAYGQQLAIEQGLLRFAGPYNNPVLDILALRPNLAQRVGVTVTGTAQAPRIRLYADPDMPEADKLAWLVLGRPPAAGGAESALLQQAALALLGGRGEGIGAELARTLGLDELSLASRSATSAEGSTVSGTALTLGKRLSKDFYVAYESSVSGAFGTLFIFYELSRKLSLRAQAGEYNALDLLYTIRHD